jgi:hypothetical protein
MHIREARVCADRSFEWRIEVRQVKVQTSRTEGGGEKILMQIEAGSWAQFQSTESNKYAKEDHRKQTQTQTPDSI